MAGLASGLSEALAPLAPLTSYLTGTDLPGSAPPTTIPGPPVSQPDILPHPPDLSEHVRQQAERRLPVEARTPLLLLRVSMLLQDAVEAACMCARAHIDAPLLAKHLLGSEQHQAFVAATAASSASGDGDRAEAEVAEFAEAVTPHVGEVRMLGAARSPELHQPLAHASPFGRRYRCPLPAASKRPARLCDARRRSRTYAWGGLPTHLDITTAASRARPPAACQQLSRHASSQTTTGTETPPYVLCVGPLLFPSRRRMHTASAACCTTCAARC